MPTQPGVMAKMARYHSTGMESFTRKLGQKIEQAVFITPRSQYKEHIELN